MDKRELERPYESGKNHSIPTNFISYFIRRCKRKGNYFCLLVCLIMITTLALGGVRYRCIHQDQVVKSTVRKVAAKAAMLKKVGLRAVFRTALLWCVYLMFPLPLWQTLGMQIIILALPVCYFLLWRSSDIIRIKVLIFSYNGLSQLYHLGLWAILFHVWAVFFHRVNVTLSVPLILGGTQKVQISKGGNKYTV